MMELAEGGLRFECERFVPIDYKGHRVRGGLKLDLLVEGRLVVELKAVEALQPVHSAQVLTYLRLTGFPAGLLMNFNVTSLRAVTKEETNGETIRSRCVVSALVSRRSVDSPSPSPLPSPLWTCTSRQNLQPG